MRVLFINSVYKSGSTGMIAYAISEYLRQEGHETAICYGRGGKMDEKGMYRFSPRWEVYLHALLTRVTGLTGCYSPVGTHRLLKYIRAFKPDVVHLHELHAYFVNWGPVIRYLKKHHIPTVWTFHCEWAYTGKCGVSADCERWERGCGHCPYKKLYIGTVGPDFTAQMWRQKKRLLADWREVALAAPSEWLAARAQRSFFAGRDVHVIPNGIDTAVFRPRPFDQLKEKHGLKDEKVVLSVGADIMSENKGGKKFLELAERFKGEPVRFIIIGMKPDQLNAFSFPPNVIPLARTENREELAAYYSMADVFVTCSKQETYPTVCLEAVACGAPVCGFDVGGTRETCPGRDEYFVQRGDIPGLEAAVRKTLNAPPAAVETPENLDKAAMVRDYLRLYLAVQEKHTEKARVPGNGMDGAGNGKH